MASHAGAAPKITPVINARPKANPRTASEGVVLIYGHDEQAIEAGNLLKDHLDVTVLIKPPADVAPPRVTGQRA